MIEILRESPFFKQILWPKFIEYERNLGRQEGQYQMLLKELPRILAFRFSLPAGHFENQFQRLDSKTLEQLHEAAFTVSSQAEFEDLLTQLLASQTH